MVVILGYAMAIVLDAGTPSSIIAVGLFAMLATVVVSADDPLRSERRIAGICFGILVVAIGVTRSTLALEDSRVVTVLYDLGVIVVVLLVARAAIGEVNRRNRRADALLAISLGPEESIRGLLADAFGDPTIKVAYALRETVPPRWVDELGRSTEAPSATGSRSRPVVVNDEVVAVITSELEMLDDPDVQRSAAAVAATASHHAMLRARLRSDAVALEASRKRLLVADDEARVGFSLELAGGATASLRKASKIVDALPTDGFSDDVGATVDSAREQLARARSDLSRFAAGLGPVELDDGGLEAALGVLARSGPIPVDLDVGALGWLPRDVAVGAYFVCAEGVANAWKHAMATAIHVSTFRRGDSLVLEVFDDGGGGVRLEPGQGLGHLAERAAAMHGTLTIVSPVGSGTRLTAELPIGNPAVTIHPHSAADVDPR
jgi:signal transduction histidine kinase